MEDGRGPFNTPDPVPVDEEEELGPAMPQNNQDGGKFYYHPEKPAGETPKKTYGPLDQPDRPVKSGAPVWLVAMLGVFCALLVAVCAVLAVQSAGTELKLKHSQTEIQRYKDEIDGYHKEISALEEETSKFSAQNDDLREELEFYDYYYGEIGFVVQDSEYYHHFDCEVFQAADGYWAHNTAYCEYLDYSPCPLCWGE